MKKFAITSSNQLPAVPASRGENNSWHAKEASPPAVLGKGKAIIVEVAPGNLAFSYHYHQLQEEVFYIIEGQGVLETIDGDIPVQAGDTLSFPVGLGGSHAMKNCSNAPLIYIDFTTVSPIEIACLPKANKIKVTHANTFGKLPFQFIDMPPK
jgi:uncharacterized cupin superfamily protein